MRKVALVFCLVVLAGCPKKKTDDGADAASEAAAAQETPTTDDAAAAAPPTLPTAKNEGDVARYKAETSLGDDDDKITVTSIARTSPKSGTVVATLKPGTEVGKVAGYQESVLITFVDPKDANITLMGWVGKEAFAAAVVQLDAGKKPVVDAGPPKDAGPPAFTCPKGNEAINLAAGPACKKKCSKDAECQSGAAGACAIASALHGGRAVRVCVND